MTRHERDLTGTPGGADASRATGEFACPLPLADYPNVVLGHGGGGRLMGDLIQELFLPAFAGSEPEPMHDGAVLPTADGRIAFTTDSYVVDPLFFPGGDIGKLAVCGTVNDLAACGAEPLGLSAGFIVEEGFAMESLHRVAQSMQAVAERVGVRIVTGDTKVVERGKADGLFINTAGVGRIADGVSVHPRRIVAGDAVLLSGDVGRHGMAIMAQREGLSFESVIDSDCAPLSAMVQRLLAAGIDVHCVRDLTRGGLASALVELARASGCQIEIEEAAVPVRDDVRGACEILGLDPLYVANEGRLAALVPEAVADRAIDVMRADAEGATACRIGRVSDAATGTVSLVTPLGVPRLLDLLSGEQLPRIC